MAINSNINSTDISQNVYNLTKKIQPKTFGSKAFTLIEVLIAVSVSTLLFALVYNLLFSTINHDKVSERYNQNIFQSRIVLLKIQRELRDCRDLIHPKLTAAQTLISSKYIVYKDRLNKIKTIYLDLESQEVKIFEIQLPEGSYIPNKKVLGKSIESLVFTYDIKSSSSLQFRIGTKDFQLVGAVRLLNV
ncbi:prepilin-type N-terminal cleavage/methylation domain-containing protein [bacterium]|nr:prepilin-type N-terminal cleavage/methylation domain-containing protein [bacterium]